MKKYSVLFLMMFALSFVVKAQDSSSYKVVFQLVTGDSTQHKSFIKQLNNILTEAPRIQMEVVCHGPGLNFLVKNKTVVHHAIKNLTERGVRFVACENSMINRKVAKEDVVLESEFVKAGIVEIVDKQSKGWAYIKAGS